jgi:ribonuclease R
MVPHLEDLYTLYQLMHKRRVKYGLLDFDATESTIQFDAAGRIAVIRPLLRNDAHRLIEEFMLAANVAAAEFLILHQIPTLFRNHEPPDEEKLVDLRAFLGEFGLHLGGGDTPGARDYAAVIEAVKGRDDAHLVETVLLRSMQLAVYSETNLGHFGLAFDAYTHFTSPIRRYPDLLVHRAIRRVTVHDAAQPYPYNREDMRLLGESCSMTERRAEDAARNVVQRLKCEFMRDKVGEVFHGTVSSVTAFGLFVELDEVFVEGLIHVTSLPNDYYHFDAVGRRLKGERTGTSYRLANRLRVRVVRVDVDDGKIDFELV